MIEMTDALPLLEGDVTVGRSEVEAFREKGHTVLRGLASAQEIAAFRPHIKSVALNENRELRPIEERDTYGKAFLQMWNLWRVSESVRQFSHAKRFAKVAAELMGVEGVRIYHDQAIFKEGGGGPTPWHQDQFYWPLDSDNMITMWMPLVDIPAEIGTMDFVSGSQRLGYLGDFPISDASQDQFQREILDRGLVVETHGAAVAGDATFHAGWMLHSAGPNPTEQMREVMTVIYFADGMRVTPPNNDAQAVDLERWLPGLKPGDLAASELNPLLYSV